MGLLSSLALLCVSAAPASASVRYVDEPVEFKIKNTNTSGVECESDKAEYTVRGHLVAPRTMLRRGQTRTVALYLYGFEGGQWNWRFREVPGYDWSVEMAKDGHASVTIDMLGYGASDHPPDGSKICMGSQADVTHQIIQQLRGGTYKVIGSARASSSKVKAPPSFSKVVLVAHDVGGDVAEIEAYSYKPTDIDALILMTWADQGFTPEPFRLAAKETEVCNQGGEEGHGYFHFAPQEESYWREKLFYNAEESVIEAAFRLREKNPCGYGPSVFPSVAIDHQRDGEVHVPVLIVFGNNDQLIWTRKGEEEQQNNYTGTSDVRTVFIENAGHFLMLERSVPTLGDVVSSWLCQHGLVASPCRGR